MNTNGPTFSPGPTPNTVRLLGVGATKLTREPIAQGNLFEGDSHSRENAADQSIDTIRAKFGTASLQRGRLLKKSKDL